VASFSSVFRAKKGVGLAFKIIVASQKAKMSRRQFVQKFGDSLLEVRLFESADEEPLLIVFPSVHVEFKD